MLMSAQARKACQKVSGFYFPNAIQTRGVARYTNVSDARAALVLYRKKEEREKRSRKRAQRTQEEECRRREERGAGISPSSGKLPDTPLPAGIAVQLLQIPPNQHNAQAKILESLIESAVSKLFRHG